MEGQISSPPSLPILHKDKGVTNDGPNADHTS